MLETPPHVTFAKLRHFSLYEDYLKYKNRQVNGTCPESSLNNFPSVFWLSKNLIHITSGEEIGSFA